MTLLFAEVLSPAAVGGGAEALGASVAKILDVPLRCRGDVARGPAAPGAPALAMTWKTAALWRARHPLAPYVLFLLGAELTRDRSALAGRLRHAIIEGATALLSCSPFAQALLPPALAARVLPVGPVLDPATWEGRSPRPRPAPEAPLSLVSIGRMVPRKGHDLAISVAARLAEQRQVSLSILGRGPDLDRLRTLAGEQAVPGLDVQIRHGVSDQEKVAILDAADALLFLPRHEAGEFEGLGLVCLEAATRLRPSVALPCGGSPFAVLDGVSGVVVHHWSNDLAGRVAAAVEDAIQVFDADRTSAWTDGFRAGAWVERTRAALGPSAGVGIEWERVWPSPG